MTEQHRCPKCGALMFAGAVRHNDKDETVWRCSRLHWPWGQFGRRSRGPKIAHALVSSTNKKDK